MSKLVNNPNDIFEQTLNDLFIRRGEEDVSLLFRIISLVLFQDQNHMEILSLYKATDLDTFLKIITLFDNKTIKFPKKKELKDSLTLALCYYYREVEHMSWEEIKALLPFEISSISYGIRIRNMNKALRAQIEDLFEKME